MMKSLQTIKKFKKWCVEIVKYILPINNVLNRDHIKAYDERKV